MKLFLFLFLVCLCFCLPMKVWAQDPVREMLDGKQSVLLIVHITKVTSFDVYADVIKMYPNFNDHSDWTATAPRTSVIRLLADYRFPLGGGMDQVFQKGHYYLLPTIHFIVSDEFSPISHYQLRRVSDEKFVLADPVIRWQFRKLKADQALGLVQ